MQARWSDYKGIITFEGWSRRQIAGFFAALPIAIPIFLFAAITVGAAYLQAWLRRTDYHLPGAAPLIEPEPD